MNGANVIQILGKNPDGSVKALLNGKAFPQYQYTKCCDLPRNADPKDIPIKTMNLE